MKTNVEVSVVVPVFNESGLLGSFLDRLTPILNSVTQNFEVIFVDDGSTDSTWEQIAGLSRDYEYVRAVKLLRNYGKEIALYAGLEAAHGLAHIPMDVDFQDPPDLIPDLVRRWRQGEKHVIPFRQERSGNRLRALLSSSFHRVMENLSGGKIRGDIGDFRIIDRSVTERFLSIKDSRRYNKGLFIDSGGDPTYVPFRRPESTRDGRPSQSLDKLLDLAQVALLNNSGHLLRWGSLISGLVAFATASLLPIVVLIWFLGLLVVPGQATVIVLGLLIISGQVFMFSILALMASDISSEIRNRPLYFVEAHLPDSSF